MGCACQISSKQRIIRMTFNFNARVEDATGNISRDITEDTTEDTHVQTVTIFSTHKTPLTKSPNHPMMRFSDGGLKVRCLRAYNSTSLEADGEFSSRPNSLGNVPAAHTVKNYIRQSIVLEASRFRLEQRNSIWDKYEVVKTLGKGAFGEVRMIQNLHTKARRALKTISKTNCEASKNFLEEIEILKQLVMRKITLIGSS